MTKSTWREAVELYYVNNFSGKILKIETEYEAATVGGRHLS